MARTRMRHRWLTALGGSIVVAAGFAWLPLQAAAADLRQGNDVTVGSGETVNDDVYAGAGTISINGTVNGSVVAGGGTITVSGNVTRDLILGGGNITVNGHVGGSIIAAGGNITVTGAVAQGLQTGGGGAQTATGAAGRRSQLQQQQPALLRQRARIATSSDVLFMIVSPYF